VHASHGNLQLLDSPPPSTIVLSRSFARKHAISVPTGRPSTERWRELASRTAGNAFGIMLVGLNIACESFCLLRRELVGLLPSSIVE